MKIKRMNKKAQLDETMIWLVAVIVIFFILLIFIAGVAGLLPGKLTENLLQNNRVEGKDKFLDLEKANNIKSFIDGNEEIISDWADSEGNKDLEKSIKDSAKDFFDTSNQDLDLKITSGENSLHIWRSLNDFEPIKFFILSKQGRIVSITYNE